MSAVERESRSRLDPELTAFLRPCYLAFQLGYYTLAAGAGDVAERARLQMRINRYANLLATELASS
jgi:hypothetical protein